MTARKSLLLVIDASVMQSAGETDNPLSSACRSTLLTVLEICHRVATTARIRAEWKGHMSRFSRKWLCSMAARRKYPQDIDPERIVVDTADLSDKERAAIEKDIHLLEAALSADRIIVTRDDAFRAALAKTREARHRTKSIRWINPAQGEDWLKSP